MIVKNKPITASMKQSGLVIGFIWFIGFLYAIREAIVNDLVEYDLNGFDYVSCIVSEEYQDTAKYFIFIDIFILFLIPLIIIVSNYVRVIKKLSLTITDLDIQENEIADKQALQAIKMLVTLMILFCICTVSPMILKLYSLFAGKFENFNVLETSVYMFSYSNSWFNLIVFGIFREDLREGAKNLFCKKTKKEKARDAWATKVRLKLNLVKADIGDVSELAQQRRAMMMMEF